MPALPLADAAAQASGAAGLGSWRLRPRVWTAAAVLLLWGSGAGFVWHGRTQRLDQAAELAERRVSRLADDLTQTLALAKVAIAQTDARLRALPPGASLGDALGTLSPQRVELLAAQPLPFDLHALTADGREIALTAAPMAGTGHRSTYAVPTGPAGVWAVGLTQGPPGARELPLTLQAAPNALGVAAYAVDLAHQRLQQRFDAGRLPRGGSVVLHRVEPDGSATVLARAPLVESEINQRVHGPLLQALAQAPRGVFSAPGTSTAFTASWPTDAWRAMRLRWCWPTACPPTRCWLAGARCCPPSWRPRCCWRPA